MWLRRDLALGTPAVVALGAVAILSAGVVEAKHERDVVRIPAGSYIPLYSTAPAGKGDAHAHVKSRVAVGAFHMDVHPVTNAEYLGFVTAHPEWRRSRVVPRLADAAYLRHWKGDLELGDRAPADAPVVHVSWFAARAYLVTKDKVLPTRDQWEYVAAASETSRDGSGDLAFRARLRALYGQPPLQIYPPVYRSARNAYGVKGLHDLVREWTDDLSPVHPTGGDEKSRFCGSTASGATTLEDYAAFLRDAFRSSLDARYCLANLGFRGVSTSTAR